MGEPCDECRRVHPGECLPGDKTVKHCITIPARVDRLFREVVPWGERSAWIARLIEAELGRVEMQSARGLLTGTMKKRTR